MKKYHVRIVAGWCGNRVIMIENNLSRLFAEKGYDIKLDHQSVWDNPSPPQYADLVLQLIPAFNDEELNGLSVAVRPFVRDIDDEATLKKIFEVLERDYPVVTKSLDSNDLIYTGAQG